MDENHTLELNKNLPKDIKSKVTTRVRPKVEQTHREIHKLQKTIVDNSLILKEEDGPASVTQLGRTLTQWTYRIKSKVASVPLLRLRFSQLTFSKNLYYDMMLVVY